MAGEMDKIKQEDVFYNHEGNSEEDKDEPTLISLEKLSLGRSKKLLVLDLGGILCDRVFNKNCASIPERPPDSSNGSFLVYKRPYCEEFIRFCFERFELGIWSSAKRHNLMHALDCVMAEHRSKLLFVWGQDECTNSGFYTLENKAKPIFLKELTKLWESKDSNLSWPAGKFSSANTLLIDDQPYKALLNPPHTGIFPAAYNVKDENDEALGPDGELWRFLDGLVEAADVTSYVEGHPFGQPSITAAHPDWGFYSNIINVLQG
ncbi:hypothetical protein Tsubulata_026355 [Turnera subulata]|uniref:Mitochondrial import inner membrane translocase subunit TIM50 n=1 Tax=Turnera subulata TaxID=218843 RepID=A0A9Q0FLN7_9ROSI|nr:hypothetical protein Tsubulata_026355 [Turnera subulata]